MSTVSPASGPLEGGRTVTVTGLQFTGASAVVFGTTITTDLEVVSDTTLRVVTPPHAAAAVSVKVTNAAGTSLANYKAKYRFQDHPTITKLLKVSSPTAGGLDLTIQGTSLRGATDVFFGDLRGTILRNGSDRSLVVKTPPHQPGVVKLVVRNPSGSSAAVPFSYFGSGNAPTTWRTTTAGRAHSCGIRTDNTLWCWGANENGQLGIGDSEERTVPRPVGQGTWLSVTAAADRTCGIRTDKTLWCWGDGLSLLTQVGTDTWDSVSLGADRACGIRSDDSLWCWSGGAGTPTAVDDNHWDAVGVGGTQTCGIRADQTLWCWDSDQPVPAPVGVGTWSSISMGPAHACGIRSTGTLACWGSNVDGELGLGDRDDRATPADVGSDTWKNVTATAAHHTCGTKTDDSLWCWGDNASGQLGVGTSGQQLQPVPVGSKAPLFQPLSDSGADTVEDWSDLDDVRAEGVQVAGNRLYSTGSSGTHGYTKSLDFPEHGAWTFQQVLYLEGGTFSPSPVIKVGVSFGDPATGFSSTDPDALGWQMKFSTRARSTFQGKNLRFALRNKVVAGPSLGAASGAYLFTIDADEHFYSFSLKRAGYPAELASFKLKRSELAAAGKSITKVYASISDKRGDHGSSLSPFIFHPGSLQPANASVAGQTIVGAAQHVVNTGGSDDSPMSWYVALPPGDLTHAPLVIDLPQSFTGDGDDAWTEKRMASIIDAVTKAGFIFASSTDVKDRFGNQIELDNYKALNDYVLSHFGTDRDVFLFGTSMGTVGAISLVGRGVIDAKAVATIGFAGGFDYLWDILGGTKRADIRNAYGFTGSPTLEERRALTAGYDPLLSFIRDSDFAGRAFRFYTGASDTTTPKALSDTMSDIVTQAGASESEVVVGDGGHLSSMQFQGSDLVAFYRRNFTLIPASDGVTRWPSVTVGGEHTCAIQLDDSLWCWGENSSGQLGFDSLTDKSWPARLSN